MKRLILIFVCIVGYIANIHPIFAHPLDISNTTFTLYEKSVEWVTYIHPVQLDRILSTRGDISPTAITVDTYYTLTWVLTRYIEETIELKNNNDKCSISNFAFQEWLMIDEIFTRGFPISYTFSCDTRLESPIATIRFLTDVPLQTNKLNIYTTLLGNGVEKIDYSILNIKKESLNISLSGKKMLSDDDGDGLSNEDEILYGTLKDKRDTDADGYSDLYEIQNSWNPLTHDLSPGQKPYDLSEETETHSNLSSSANWKDETLQTDSAVWWWVWFSNILRDLRIYLDTSDSSSHWFFLLLISVLGLGFFHALGPGHSKWILISQIMNRDIWMFGWIMYSLFFSIVHILDIIIVVLVSRFLFEFVDIQLVMTQIQQLSVFLILIIGVYLLRDAIRNYSWQKKVTKTSPRWYLSLAIITWLTPCAFGWSIFLMLLATGRWDLAIPLFLSLWAGIFLCLFLITILVTLFKTWIFRFAPKIGQLSPIISSSFIIVIGVSLFITHF